MALRFVLMSLVAGMGLELPSGQELSSWTRAGRDWAGARMVEFCSIRAEAERAFRGATDCERDEDGTGSTPTADLGDSTADLAFDVVVEGMASSFAADLAASRPDGPESIAPLEAVAEQTRGEGPPIPGRSDLKPGPASAETRPGAVSEVPAMATRLDRFSAAVRLTRQALDAWALLIEGSSEILTDSR